MAGSYSWGSQCPSVPQFRASASHRIRIVQELRSNLQLPANFAAARHLRAATSTECSGPGISSLNRGRIGFDPECRSPASAAKGIPYRVPPKRFPSGQYVCGPLHASARHHLKTGYLPQIPAKNNARLLFSEKAKCYVSHNRSALLKVFFMLSRFLNRAALKGSFSSEISEPPMAEATIFSTFSRLR